MVATVMSSIFSIIDLLPQCWRPLPRDHGHDYLQHACAISWRLKIIYIYIYIYMYFHAVTTPTIQYLGQTFQLAATKLSHDPANKALHTLSLHTKDSSKFFDPYKRTIATYTHQTRPTQVNTSYATMGAINMPRFNTYSQHVITQHHLPLQVLTTKN